MVIVLYCNIKQFEQGRGTEDKYRQASVLARVSHGVCACITTLFSNLKWEVGISLIPRPHPLIGWFEIPDQRLALLIKIKESVLEFTKLSPLGYGIWE